MKKRTAFGLLLSAIIASAAVSPALGLSIGGPIGEENSGGERGAAELPYGSLPTPQYFTQPANLPEAVASLNPFFVETDRSGEFDLSAPPVAPREIYEQNPAPLCNYCGDNRMLLAEIDPEALALYGSDRCVQALCPSDSAIVGNVPFYSQCDFSGPSGDSGLYCRNACGIASLKMGLEALGWGVQEIPTLWESVGCGAGAGCPGIYTYMQDNGLSSRENYFYIANLERIQENIDSGIPMILAASPETYFEESCNSGRSHFVLVTGYARQNGSNFLIVNEPRMGNAQFPGCVNEAGENLLLRWSTLLRMNDVSGSIVPLEFPPSYSPIKSEHQLAEAKFRLD